jgi:N-acetylmuramoyl-L-alanine amidase
MKKFFLFILLVSLIFLPFTSFAKEFVVSIDIGHHLQAQGVRAYSGTREYFFNKNIAFMLNDKLKSMKISSFIIDTTGEITSLTERSDIAYEKGASIMVVIHHDSVQEQDFYRVKEFKGYSLFVSKISPNESLSLAENIGYKLKEYKFIANMYHNQQIQGENKKLLNRSLGVYEYTNLIILKHSKVPAVLIECGIVVNPNEEWKLLNKDYQEQLVEAIALGILCYRDSINH